MLDGNHLNITFAKKNKGQNIKTTTTNENYTFFASITFNKLPALYETENIKEIVWFFFDKRGEKIIEVEIIKF